MKDVGRIHSLKREEQVKDEQGPQAKIYVLKNDRYRRSMGGQTRLMNICCYKCGSTVLVYQKDGPPGHLHKSFINRIFDPPEYEKLQYDKGVTKPEDLPKLECKKCKIVIGSPIRYDDGRLAFRLMQGRFFADLNHNFTS